MTHLAGDPTTDELTWLGPRCRRLRPEAFFNGLFSSTTRRPHTASRFAFPKAEQTQTTKSPEETPAPTLALKHLWWKFWETR